MKLPECFSQNINQHSNPTLTIYNKHNLPISSNNLPKQYSKWPPIQQPLAAQRPCEP